MAKSNIQHSITSFGIYDKWEDTNKSLPKIKEFTVNVPAKIDIEFGFIINIKKGKGKKITYCIYHPNIPDDDGKVMPPFIGEMYIRDNNWNFYLGDTIWAPINNKLGDWRMTITCENKIIADKTFRVDEPNELLEASFWKRAGY
ncbi:MULTISPECIES: DUF3859 domain-containing protein [Colwelliaceae]|uniref:DUF3859 domain-containing protein n=1 Tax=Colwelliaceae TaxID=267889 RepID=UPI000970ED92|nr:MULTISPECIES: DUF3859 domain-containing protein [Colwelliaceae]